MNRIDVKIGPDAMNHHFTRLSTLVPAILLAATLASCGGGGSASPPPPAYQSPVITVPAANYASAASPADNLAVANSINSTVRTVGFGLLAQNTALDTAAGKHASFLVDNGLVADTSYLTSTQTGGILGGHFEDNTAITQTNFTGASPQVRATAAGYAGTVTELMIFGAADGAACIASLENSVYHLIALVSPYVDMGISFNAGSGSGSACAIVMGLKNSTLGQLPASAPTVYPGASQTGIAHTFHNQAEWPIPAPDLDPVGHPVIASLYTLANPSLAASDIVINEFTITPDGGSALTNVRILAKTGVTSGPSGPTLTVDDTIPAAGFVVLLPEAPLLSNTVYNLSFNATVKTATVTKSWSFTTAP